MVGIPGTGWDGVPGTGIESQELGLSPSETGIGPFRSWD